MAVDSIGLHEGRGPQQRRDGLGFGWGFVSVAMYCRGNDIRVYMVVGCQIYTHWLRQG